MEVDIDKVCLSSSEIDMLVLYFIFILFSFTFFLD